MATEDALPSAQARPLARAIAAAARNRLLHFVAIGALLWLVAPREKDEAVVIDAARIEAALRDQRSRLARPLTTTETSEVVSFVIEEEILAREAVRVGLGTDDPIVRARLADRMRASFPEPSVPDDELLAEAARLADSAPDRVKARFHFFRRERSDAASAAEELLAGGRALAPVPSGIEDRSPLPQDSWWTEGDLTRAASDGVARAAFTTSVGRASPVVSSAWGFYVVVPLERRKAEPAELRAEARARLLATKRASFVTQLVARVKRETDVRVNVPEELRAELRRID